MRSCAVVLAVVLAGCGGTGVVEITDAWAGTTPPNADAAAIYLEIENGSSVTLQVAEVTSERCETTEIHESRIDDQQVMRMRPAEADSLEIPSGDRLEMRPGALHVMCVGVIAPFADGDRFGVSVGFEDGSTVSGSVTVENR